MTRQQQKEKHDQRGNIALEILKVNLGNIGCNPWSDEKHIERAFAITDMFIEKRDKK